MNLDGRVRDDARLLQAGRDQHFHVTIPIGVGLFIGLIVVLLLWTPIGDELVNTIIKPSPSTSSVSSENSWHQSDPLPAPTVTIAPTPSPAPPAPTPSDPPDPDDVAIAAIRIGDCLSFFDTGLGEWNRRLPATVDCRGYSAYNRVSLVAKSKVSCPSGNGRSRYQYMNRDGSVTVLCMERQFTKGSCFYAYTANYQSYTGFLSTVADCKKPSWPDGSNVVMAIMDIIATGGSCPILNPGDHSASWPVLDGSATLCAVAILVPKN
ncbi:hypothetical protein ACIQ9P_03895 [Kitasatospora sp. NPDC094019]|uniref:hypothetical protein n=1 Tax=Kitasatospora sp. NPDC094019 TaxID=3364091 RepID=UPI00381C08E2